MIRFQTMADEVEWAFRHSDWVKSVDMDTGKQFCAGSSIENLKELSRADFDTPAVQNLYSFILTQSKSRGSK